MHYGVVYAAFNTNTGKYYVGQAICGKSKVHPMVRRMKQHLGHKVDFGLPFYRSLKRDGKDVFVWSVLSNVFVTEISQQELDAAECYWITELCSMHPTGYNMRGGGARGGHSAESKKKLALKSMGNQSHKGFIHSEKDRKSISDGVLRAFAENPPPPMSKETAAKISRAKKGVEFTPAHCSAIGDAQRGKKRSPEAIAKSAAGNRHPRGPYKKKGNS